LWDPALNNLAYWFDYEADHKERKGDKKNLHHPDSLMPAAKNPHAPTSWFHFDGPWGDETLPLSDTRQWRLFGQYHYTEGPFGPRFKHLERHKVCQTQRCRILWSLEEGRRSTWYS
jgi:hypothetical protein